jgi:UDP-GlcNAc:undecaprenyl-phosphate GlcNAc-1-phosphate transferase
VNRPSFWLYPVVFALSFGAAAVFTPLLRRFAIAQGLSDAPSERKAHPEPIALLGGVAIFAASGMVLWMAVPAAAKTLKGVLLAGLVILVVGLQDDVSGMDPWLKLVSQATAALVLVGFGVSAMPIGNGIVDTTLTVVWVLAIVNAINLSDNMDGLAAGLSVISCAGFFALAVSFDQYLVATLSAVLGGGALGFLIYNYPPAKIFMGDAGSHLLGFLLAVMGILIEFPTVKKPVGIFIPGLVIAVPVLDMALVVVSRIRRRVPVSKGGTDHASHRLVVWGLDRRGAIAVLWAAAALGCTAAFLAARLPGWWGLVPVGVYSIGALCGLAVLEARGAPEKLVFDRESRTATAS